MLRRRRPLMRAAVVGGTAYAAGKHMSNKAQHEADQDEQIAQAQDAQVPAQAQPASAPAGTAEPDRIAALTQLKELLDSGVLSQAEFDTEKAKVLAGS